MRLSANVNDALGGRDSDDPNRGIVAARDYIKRQFDQIAARSDGRMTTYPTPAAR
jgi:hypothetical protein